ncbi:bifunctional D-glycero-beta-D-manno-heptose-7-phosphate kinase/D-glycero-beta-D-manno-heptose 1-phosphate adenylyltransferase HldE [Chromatium okenii]|uniref:bifunctional D-glycero-beta-D-manno-heptose-7-phosphate kinase/D-glycero-beta-D-manno-heptose 1-phosphate adenylyltransferase HldE n=1 Tax=Chromatium okenii TaxID=61644 RepID=UPI0026EFE921|nr:bifunctional D-glycero-beta-D-manno-heptose-7-phosphate kinase/D-glycero-beta-D-manno-heptose 1-phosphate adenylyltransferase HldE [Chromatium okenii]MBV5309789.1 bifunctional D-glycero-beta-D-manno-heptose-7-phosphate kinase/D-glycero-beta-D-manno-heptose 1-phosphate adenylyltransferase HldE [Chromatium okenii]
MRHFALTQLLLECLPLRPIPAFPFPEFTRTAVLVAGDLMLDRYWSGATTRISPEAPVPVVQVTQIEERPGGAANVARNLAALGVRTTVVGVTGADDAADRLAELLTAAGITARFCRRAEVPTITKLRVMSQHQQLLRLDFEQSLAPVGDDPLPALVTQLLADADLLLLSDYAKGTLADPQPLIAAARARSIPVLIDPKGRDFTRYRGATLLTPNLHELECIVGVCGDDAILIDKSQRLRKELNLTALLVTLGERGMLLLAQDAAPLHLPTQAREVFDVTGAGDTVIATLAAALAAGVALADACALANDAAGLAVGKLGTATVSAAELKQAAGSTEWPTILTAESLEMAVAAAQARGERVVMTNGCFDLLHAGHVAYLQQARQLGDRLVVAVNDDASVRRLKGIERPINSLAQRMAVLAGLAAVDWLCAFSEDTPEQLICRVKPDVLVKGGDYQIAQIAGADCVRAQGGEVRILDFVSGCSTSQIIGTIRDV